MSDFITVLYAPSPMAKTFSGPELHKTDYTNPELYEAIEMPVASIRELSGFLAELEGVPNACIIRGKLKEGSDPTSVRRRKLEWNGITPDFAEAEAGHHWLMLDFDKVPVHGLTTNEERLDHLVAMMPPAFHNASYHYQWSASAGIAGWNLLSCHLWFWLSEPWRDGLLIERIKDQDWQVDESTIRTVQPNYTAKPIFVDCDDPISGIRSGFVERTNDVVTLNPWVRPAVRTFNNAMKIIRAPARSFEEKLMDIGPRYHHPINVAIAHYVATNEAFDRNYLLDRIRDRIMVAPPGTSPKHIYLNDRYLNASIDGALAKFRR